MSGPPAAPARSAAGFTLVEMVVATALLLLALLLVSDLLDESGRLLHHSARRARDPWTLLAGEQLRNDLRGSRPAAGSGGAWLRLPLALDVPGTGAVVWRWSGTELRRSVDGVERPVLRSLSGFRWRTLPGGAVEVEVAVRASGGWGRQLGGALPRGDEGRTERLHWLVLPGIDRSGW